MTLPSVLVLDGDASGRDALCQALAREGFRVLRAATGREALNRLGHGHALPDILLLDLVLPDLTGYEILAHLGRRGHSDVPVLLLSGHPPDGRLIGALAEGHRDFIAKPFDLNELVIRLRLLLRGAGRERADDAQDLRVHTLGALRVYRGETLLFDEGWPNKPAKTVFKALLSARGHALSGETLAEVVWPEAAPGVGANRLRVAVHDVRQRLGDRRSQGRPPRLIAHRGAGYIFDPEGCCWVDAHAFEHAVSRARDRQGQGHADEALAAYQEADALYGGDYLPDDPWADWIVGTRERLRELHLTLLAETAQLQARRGAVEEAVRSCRRILRVEPWREEVYRQVMGYLAGAGRRGEALRVFEECRRALEAEGVEPAPATWQLRARIAALGRQSAAAAVGAATLQAR